MDVSIRASILNLLDELYISDATNNSYTQSFDATGASVYIGQGRRWTASVGLKF
jgi:outer membrane receptor protein involved in Fe transport